MGHCAETGQLVLQFHPGKKAVAEGKPGPVYRYPMVAEDFEALRKAPSLGSHFIKHIKGNAEKYPHTRIEAEEQEEPLMG